MPSSLDRFYTRGFGSHFWILSLDIDGIIGSLTHPTISQMYIGWSGEETCINSVWCHWVQILLQNIQRWYSGHGADTSGRAISRWLVLLPALNPQWSRRYVPWRIERRATSLTRFWMSTASKTSPAAEQLVCVFFNQVLPANTESFPRETPLPECIYLALFIGADIDRH